MPADFRKVLGVVELVESWGGRGRGDSTFHGDFDRRIGDFFGRDPQRC